MVKRVLILTLLAALALSACDALPMGSSPTVAPPSDAGVAEVGYLSKVIFDLANAVAGDYRVVINGVEFSCRTYEDHPDQLFCFGPELPVGEHLAQIFAGDQTEPLFTLTVTVTSNEIVVTATPAQATPTLAPVASPTPTMELQPTPTLPDGEVETPTPTLPPPTPTLETSPTLAPDEAIKVFYFNLDETGRYGCGEAMYWVKTTQRITANTINNINYGLHTLFIYHQPKFGELYNPYGASENQFAVGSIELKPGGVVEVYLTGSYTPPDDPCDRSRLKDQIYRIVLQFDDVQRAFVYLNGTILEDALARK